VQAELDRERADIVSRIRNDYDGALRREKLLAADYDAQSRIVTEQAGKSIQYNILKRDVDSNRQIYESVLQQVREASVASAIRASNIRIVDPADPPRVPYSPRLRMNAFLGLLSGGVFGVALVLMRERADRTLQQPGDAQFWTNVPELGVIPSAKLDTPRHVYGKPDPEIAEAPPAAARLLARDDDSSLELITWNRKASVISEAFRNVLTSILFIGENGSRPRLLVVTSGSSGDGKTTAVSNLAIAAAEIRQKVLIIDADLRRPRLHDLFQLSNQRGLSTILRDDAIPPSSVDQFVQPTHIPNTYVLTAGPATSAAAHLLYSPVLPEILAKFRAQYDMVLIDTPPSLNLTDARVIGRLADAVVFVARAGQTTKDVAIVLSRRFLEDRTRVLGTILNDWNPHNSVKGHYSYYSYYPTSDRKTRRADAS
jgi:capsular exopolysaccharide synthesis family protein